MTDTEDAYFGTAEIRALQRSQDSQVPLLRKTPGAVIHARTFSSDNPRLLGWDTLRQRISVDGWATLRGVTDADVEEAMQELDSFNLIQHRWDFFMADAETIRATCNPLVEAPLPDGLHQVEPEAMDQHLIHQVQRFLDDQGVSPFSKDALAGRLFPAQLVVLRDRDGNIVATGFAAMTHNQFSPFEGTAWVGLIAVSPQWRGRALGTWIDAVSNLVAVERLGATATMEFVAQNNMPSRRMLETCGLRQREGRTVAMLSTSSARLTR